MVTVHKVHALQIARRGVRHMMPAACCDAYDKLVARFGPELASDAWGEACREMDIDDDGNERPNKSRKLAQEIAIGDVIPFYGEPFRVELITQHPRTHRRQKSGGFTFLLVLVDDDSDRSEPYFDFDQLVDLWVAP